MSFLPETGANPADSLKIESPRAHSLLLAVGLAGIKHKIHY
jgi:hypothetical protein